MIRLIVTLALLFASGQNAGAQDAAAPRLKELVTITAEVVRIGDLVENAGAAANVAVFRAPDLGQTGAVRVSRVTDALKPHDLAGLDTAGLNEIVVTRLSRVVSGKDVEERIARALGGSNGFGDAKTLAVTIDHEVRPIHVDATVVADLSVARMNVDPRTGRFDVMLEIPGSALTRRGALRFTGTAVETVETATLTRAVNRGDVIRESDVTLERRPKAEVAGEPIAPEAAVGQAAKRTLRGGQALRAGDVMKADIVARNEIVTIVYEIPGLVLTVRGKALEAGGAGDTINVLNVQSNRTVQAEVSGPGLVTITAATARYAAASSHNSDNKRRRAQ